MKRVTYLGLVVACVDNGQDLEDGYVTVYGKLLEKVRTWKRKTIKE